MGGKTEKGKGPPMKKFALVVEDDEYLADIFSVFLNKMGFESVAVHLPEDALASLKLHLYDLIILDLTLPHVSGLELYNQILELRPDYRGKFIFTSGYEPTEEVVTIMEKDGVQFLQKPFQIQSLKEAISHFK